MQIRASQEGGVSVSPEVLTRAHGFFLCSLFTDFSLSLPFSHSHFGLLFPILTHQGQFSSVAQSFTTLCKSMNRSMPGLPVHHQLPELTQTHVH